jgi:hypothetical protein
MALVGGGEVTTTSIITLMTMVGAMAMAMARATAIVAAEGAAGGWLPQQRALIFGMLGS